MTQLTIAINACQTESKFYKAYHDGTPKTEYWKPVLKTLDVIAKMPEIAALIYRCSFKDGVVGKPAPDLDYSASFLSYVRI